MVTNSNLTRFSVSTNWAQTITSRDYAKNLLQREDFRRYLLRTLSLYEYSSSLLYSHFRFNSYAAQSTIKLFLYENYLYSRFFYDRPHKERILNSLTREQFLDYRSRTRLVRVVRAIAVLSSIRRRGLQSLLQFSLTKLSPSKPVEESLGVRKGRRTSIHHFFRKIFVRRLFKQLKSRSSSKFPLRVFNPKVKNTPSSTSSLPIDFAYSRSKFMSLKELDYLVNEAFDNSKLPQSKSGLKEGLIYELHRNQKIYVYYIISLLATRYKVLKLADLPVAAYVKLAAAAVYLNYLKKNRIHLAVKPLYYSLLTYCYAVLVNYKQNINLTQVSLAINKMLLEFFFKLGIWKEITRKQSLVVKSLKINNFTVVEKSKFKFGAKPIKLAHSLPRRNYCTQISLLKSKPRLVVVPTAVKFRTRNSAILPFREVLNLSLVSKSKQLRLRDLRQNYASSMFFVANRSILKFGIYKVARDFQLLGLTQDLRVKIHPIANEKIPHYLYSRFITRRLAQRFSLFETFRVLRRYLATPNLKGYLIKCGGRFTKKQRASTFTFRKGSVPVGTFSSRIDYHKETVRLKYGVCSVKIWLHH